MEIATASAGTFSARRTTASMRGACSTALHATRFAIRSSVVREGGVRYAVSKVSLWIRMSCCA
jgi:hypothetical protein